MNAIKWELAAQLENEKRNNSVDNFFSECIFLSMLCTSNKKARKDLTRCST
jgi:hypothetical protein